MSIIYSRTQDGTLNVMLSGKVVRDAEIKQTGNISRVKFTVAYGKKQYMDCETYADSDVGAIASCLEKNDTILVMGVHNTWQYKEKNYQSVAADFIGTMAVPMVAAPQQREESYEGDSNFAEEMEASSSELPF